MERWYDYSTLSLCVDGRFVSARTGRTCEPVLDPATGATLAELPHATMDELSEAVAAAARLSGVALDAALERSAILRRAAALLRERIDALATIMTLEQGKPFAEARSEWICSCEVMEWNAKEGRRVYGRIVPSRAFGLEHLALDEPVGPSVALTPWNFPALTPTRKLSAALAGGAQRS